VLTNHRRALWYSVAMLAALGFVFVGVGRHPTDDAPLTTIPFIGRWDLAVFHWSDDVRNDVLTVLARGLSVIGSGIVTIPLRIGVAVGLAFRTRWRAFAVWVATWAAAELAVLLAKPFFHRGRPPEAEALVETVGFSFPSGHAVAGAATAVALVLVLMPPGPARRRWEWAAALFAFVMASSRVYLGAHWLSDVVAGVLLGSGVALGVAALATELRDRALHRGEHADLPAPSSVDT
jgi:undecaprenyl-diphosphatase